MGVLCGKTSESDITAMVMTEDHDTSVHQLYDSKEMQTPSNKKATGGFIRPKEVQKLNRSPSRMLCNLRPFNSPGRQEGRGAFAKPLSRSPAKIGSPSRLIYRTRSKLA